MTDQRNPTDNSPVTKAILAEKYGVSSRQLAQLLNQKYFADLSAIGYDKNCQVIPPVVVRRFRDLYGDPLFGRDL